MSLSLEQKKALLEQRIQQFEAEIFIIQINKKVAEKLGNEDAVRDADTTLFTLNTGLEVYEAELASL